MQIRISGDPPTYRYFWLKTVQGFNPAAHCAASLIGRYATVRRPSDLSPGLLIEPPTGTAMYLCGVRNYAENLHVPLLATPGAAFAVDIPGSQARVEVEGAVLLPIPATADLQNTDGWLAAFTSCRNWRFGVGHFLGGKAPDAPPRPRRVR